MSIYDDYGQIVTEDNIKYIPIERFLFRWIIGVLIIILAYFLISVMWIGDFDFISMFIGFSIGIFFGLIYFGITLLFSSKSKNIGIHFRIGSKSMVILCFILEIFILSILIHLGYKSISAFGSSMISFLLIWGVFLLIWVKGIERKTKKKVYIKR